MRGIYCKNFIIIVANKNCYHSCKFVLSILGTEQRMRKMCRISPKKNEGLSGRVNESPLVY